MSAGAAISGAGAFSTVAVFEPLPSTEIVFCKLPFS